MNNNDSFFNRGFQITKTLFFKILTYRAGNFFKTPSKLFYLIKEANKNIDDNPSIGQLASHAIDNFKLLFRMIRANVRGQYNGLSKKNVLLMIAAVLYFLSPFDIIPDALPLIGFLDDISLVSWVITTLNDEVMDFRIWETNNILNEDNDVEYLGKNNNLFPKGKTINIPSKNDIETELVHYPRKR